MNCLRRRVRYFSWPVIAAMLAVWVLPPVQARAAIVSTEEIILQGGSDAMSDREQVTAYLSRDDVKRKMLEMGVDADEAKARVGGMTDAEVSVLAENIETMPSGQSAVVILLVVVLIIIIWPF